MTRDRLWPAVVGGWAVASLVLCAVFSRDIAHLWFPDTDDAMRLVEVRDWLDGQSWWDVGQHRLNGGAFAMHWSRLVDLPLAAVMWLCDPLVAQAVSTRVAMTVVPLLTLLALMALAAELTRRLSDGTQARLALLLAPLSVPLLYQIRPMRIDHHGWQVVLAMAAVTALTGRRDRRSGVLAGAALAALLTVSLEGLPITVAITGAAMLGWALAPERRRQAAAVLWTLLGGVAALQAATRGPAMLAPACDAIAPGWIAGLGAAVLVGSAAVIWSPRSAAARLGMLLLAGGAGVATLAVLTPDCLRGPFATLDPLVYRLWYRNVSEGLPVWDQVPAWGWMTIGFPLVGLIGTAAALRASTGEARERWAGMLVILGAAFALSLLVMRTGATANALALPGGAWALSAMLGRARAVVSVPGRIAATAAALLAATPGLAGSLLFARPAPASGQVARAIRPPCDRGHEMADLRALPAATLFAPVDVTPALLAWTPHRAVAGGYHRNVAAMHRVLAAFTASPARARPMILASGADYLVGCPGENETELYTHVAPQGLWARLERGERVAWLDPVAIPGSPVLVWRVAGPRGMPTPAR